MSIYELLRVVWLEVKAHGSRITCWIIAALILPHRIWQLLVPFVLPLACLSLVNVIATIAFPPSWATCTQNSIKTANNVQNIEESISKSHLFFYIPTKFFSTPTYSAPLL